MAESAKNPVLELFEGEAQRQQTFVNDAWIPFTCALAGFGAACFVNWTTRRPVFSGKRSRSKAVV